MLSYPDIYDDYVAFCKRVGALPLSFAMWMEVRDRYVEELMPEPPVPPVKEPEPDDEYERRTR